MSPLSLPKRPTHEVRRSTACPERQPNGFDVQPSTFASSCPQPGLAAAPRSSGAVAVQPFRNPKSKIRNSASAFTLIELLVVISILVILGALAFPTLRGALDGAKRTQAKNDAVQIVTAINAFYTEYGQYPCGAQPGDDASDYGAGDDATHSTLMDNLRAASGPTGYNTRGVAFLQVPTAKDPNAEAGGPKSGIGGNGRFYDPWGSCYRVRMDNNYNGRLNNPYSANAGFSAINAGAIVWSLGRDKSGGSGDKNAGAAKDDVISWQ